jgi:hypothetical protein
MVPNPPAGPAPPQCSKCQKPMAFMTTIQRVTEPGRVMVFQCEDCEKLDFKPTDQGSAGAITSRPR